MADGYEFTNDWFAVNAPVWRNMVAEMKPPRVSSDVVYLDDEIRINLGSLGGMYLLRRSTEPPFSLLAG